MPVNNVYVKKAVFLMEERRKKDSPWYDYIASMPTDWSQFPLFYSEEDFSMLKGSQIFFKMKTQEELLFTTYNLLTN